jgi:tetrahydromethanopterin S-methyltransferase subunit G
MEAMRQSWSDDRLDDLQLEMRAGFARLETQIQQRIDQVEKQIELMEKRMDQRSEQVEQRLERVEKRLDRVDERVEFGFGRLDGRIDSQTRAIVYFAGLLSTIIVALLVSRLFV